MSLKEQTIILTDKDSQGNTIMQFPITKAKNIEDVMSIAQGGTGANTVSAACKALGLDWDWFHRYGENYVPSDVTNSGWNSLGLCLIYYTEKKIKNQPTTYGQLLNIPAARGKYNESTQIWIEQYSGDLYFRGGNAEFIVNDTAFTKVATKKEDAGYGIVAALLEQNGYVKFSNGLILQWGRSTAATIYFSLSFKKFYCITTAQESWGNATFENTSWIERSDDCMTWPTYAGTAINYIALGM